uniref:Uncharacterized protein n=1 Tax=Rheinheimera sp. BAL341 TaxID=1708203 RepID=A0A486XP62_9GAMM
MQQQKVMKVVSPASATKPLCHRPAYLTEIRDKVQIKFTKLTDQGLS